MGRRSPKHTIVEYYDVVPNKKPTVEDLRTRIGYDASGNVLYAVQYVDVPVGANHTISTTNSSSCTTITPPASP
uniref:MucBP_2 domain-containing protein n=1 Tax=Caenorhabditis tropicalis TaxID=1561998 RepID=A0A1I7TGD8_9PELO